MTSKISLAFILLLPGCSTLPKANPRAEITSVLAQRQELKESDLKPDKKYPYRKPEYSKYVTEIKHLDVSRCPADFQQAWYDYLVALEQLHQHDSDDDLEGLGKLLGMAAAIYTGG